jgi:outer membrane protein OmpA-like peptidoglycan-associated protein
MARADEAAIGRNMGAFEMIKRRRRGRFGVQLAMALAVAAIGLSGCSSMKSDGVDPIEWYRDLSGNSANDAKDQAANAENLKAGSKEPYPNLATVPALPSNAISKAERDRMVKSLIADRQNAQYTDQQLRAGQNMSAIPPPATVPVLAAAPVAAPVMPATRAQQGTPGKMVAVPRAPVRQETLPAPAAMPMAGTDRAVADRTPAPADKVADKKKKSEDARKKQAKNRRGAETPPAESSLKSPTLGVMPAGEQAQAPPPEPAGAPRSARRRAPSEELAAAAPSRSDADALAPEGGGVTVKAGQINFTPGPFRARIMPADQKQLAGVAQMVMRNNGRVRVVGHGGAAAQGDLAQREFQSFNAALDNAKAVALALTKLGVPASRIDVETEANVNSPDRADIFVEY